MEGSTKDVRWFVVRSARWLVLHFIFVCAAVLRSVTEVLCDALTCVVQPLMHNLFEGTKHLLHFHLHIAFGLCVDVIHFVDNSACKLWTETMEFLERSIWRSWTATVTALIPQPIGPLSQCRRSMSVEFMSIVILFSMLRLLGRDGLASPLVIMLVFVLLEVVIEAAFIISSHGARLVIHNSCAIVVDILRFLEHLLFQSSAAILTLLDKVVCNTCEGLDLLLDQASSSIYEAIRRLKFMKRTMCDITADLLSLPLDIIFTVLEVILSFLTHSVRDVLLLTGKLLVQTANDFINNPVEIILTALFNILRDALLLLEDLLCKTAETKTLITSQGKCLLLAAVLWPLDVMICFVWKNTLRLILTVFCCLVRGGVRLLEDHLCKITKTTTLIIPQHASPLQAAVLWPLDVMISFVWKNNWQLILTALCNTLADALRLLEDLITKITETATLITSHACLLATVLWPLDVVICFVWKNTWRLILTALYYMLKGVLRLLEIIFLETTETTTGTTSQGACLFLGDILDLLDIMICFVWKTALCFIKFVSLQLITMFVSLAFFPFKALDFLSGRRRKMFSEN